MATKSGEEFRRELAWRSSFETDGRWGIPVVRRQDPPRGAISLLACSDMRKGDVADNTWRGVHHFVDDPRFESLYDNYERRLGTYSQYAFVLTPDYSLYSEMSPWMQLANVGRSRWVGAYWQSRGLTVYPSVSWGTPQTFEFCFAGIERGSTVFVGTVGSRRERRLFLQGYWEMLRAVEPEAVVCFGEPFPEMREVTAVVDYRASRRVAR